MSILETANNNLKANNGKTQVTKIDFNKPASAPASAEQNNIQLEAQEVVRRFVNPKLNKLELEYLYFVANKLGLDPSLKEIVVLKFRGRELEATPILYITHAGALKIANSNPNFNGFISDVVREGDIIKKLPDGNIEHIYAENRGKIKGAYCLVYRKDRKYPVYIYLPMEEAKQEVSATWKRYPTLMLLKTVERLALIRAFNISAEINAKKAEDIYEIKEEDGITTESVIL